MTTCQYIQLSYEDYKRLEDQMARFKEMETTHKTVTGGYHKAWRVRINDSLIFEFQGPMVKGFGDVAEAAP